MALKCAPPARRGAQISPKIAFSPPKTKKIPSKPIFSQKDLQNPLIPFFQETTRIPPPKFNASPHRRGHAQKVGAKSLALPARRRAWHPCFCCQVGYTALEKDGEWMDGTACGD